MNRHILWTFRVHGLLICLLATGIAIQHLVPPASAQFTPPALPRTYGDITTPAVNPVSGNTTVYTKAGTVCALSPAGTETCTGSGGGGGVTVAAPYLTTGGTKYVGGSLFAFTPFFSGSFLDANTSTLTAGPNGSETLTFSPASALNSWYEKAATTSIEAEWAGLSLSAADSFAGINICDTTNGKLYSLDYSSQGGIPEWFIVTWTLASCAGTPSGAGGFVTARPFAPGQVHGKMFVSGGNLLIQACYATTEGCSTLQTVSSIGTIAKAGVQVRSVGAQTIAVTYSSVAIN